jgi:hypothetical protein
VAGLPDRRLGRHAGLTTRLGAHRSLAQSGQRETRLTGARPAPVALLREKSEPPGKWESRVISDDIQRGRYLLFEKVVDAESVKRLTDEEYRDINRAIAAYNLLGVYLKNGYVNERDVMEVWGRPVYRAWLSAQPFLAWREHNQGYKAMPYFEMLAKRTEEVLTRDGSLPTYVMRRRSASNE